MKRKVFLWALMGLLQASCNSSSNTNSDVIPPSGKPTPEQALEICPTGAVAGTCKSFLMTLKGRNGQPLNANVKAAITGATGTLVTQLKLKNFVLLETYSDGGIRFCIDPVENGGYEAVVAAYSTFSVGSQTQWDIAEIKSCTGGR